MEVAPLSIRLLGGCEVRVGGQPMRSVRARSVEWLLALLVLRHGRDVSRSWMAGTLWPESGEAAALHNLRRNLMELRQALGAEAARLRTPSRAILGLDLTGADVDVVDFDQAIAAGDEQSLQTAVALYRGPLLEGCAEEWVFPERASRAEACLRALETLADRAAERGDPAAALGYLGQAAALDPLRDGTQRRRMQALTASGDVPAALLTYREHRLRLHRELNVEPDPETTQLFQELRAGVRRTTLHRPPPPIGTPEPNPAAGSPAPAAPRLDPDGVQSSARENQDSPPQIPPSPAPLPRPLTALIGREQEVQEVVQRVRASRLVTLVGGGGVGKTRLAIQAAQEIAADFSAGVAFVELASLADPALLPGHVAAALGVREADAAAGPGPEVPVQALCGWLTRHPVLLVLDNCEHLVQAVAALTHDLLSACPDLRILTTSRQRLGLTGEGVWRVSSLPAPDPDHLPADERRAVEVVRSYPAVQLFVERAAATRSGFRLAGKEDAAAVAQVCCRLDGIPLALELAAARVALLTPVQIAARLDDRFRLLTGGSRTALPRQQTLQALIDWSYHLLSEPERVLLRRLSVFAGGWTLEAAEAICADCGLRLAACGLGTDEIRKPQAASRNEEVLDLLDALVDRSLVLVDEAAAGLRYRLLETLREYAWEQLAATGDLAAARRRHRDWYLQLAEQADAAHYRLGQKGWLTRLEAELDNLRAALGWCQEEAEANPAGDGAEAGLRLAVALGWLWYSRGYLTEGLHWLEGMLARGRQLSASARAPALRRAAHLAADRGDRERSRTFFQAARREYEQVLTLARRKGNRADVARTLGALADVAAQDEDLDAAWKFCVEARPLLEELAEPVGLEATLAEMAGIAQRRGDPQAARVLLEERLAICRKLGASDLLVHALGAMGHLERDEGDYARARALYRESLLLRRELSSLFALAQSLEDLAVLAGRQQQVERAIRLLGAGEAFCETLGARPPVADAPEYERTVAEGRAALDEARFAAVWVEGRAMSLEQAVEYALEC